MASYLSISNDITEVIDDSFFNIAFIRKERKYFPVNNPGETRYWWWVDIDVSDIEHPVVAFSSICGTCCYSLSPDKVTLCVSAHNQQNIPNAVAKLNNSSNYVDVYIFGRPKDNTPSIGLKVWDANGRLVFDANHKYMKPVKTIADSNNYTPPNGSKPFNNNRTEIFDVGKTYAVFPLNRMFTIDAQYLSDGWETYWMADIYSSSCAVQDNTLYLTSGLVDKVEDVAVTTIGVCRHHYAVIDVTGY